jgi:Pilin (bacterial filament)/zinc-ribbon domain
LHAYDLNTTRAPYNNRQNIFATIMSDNNMVYCRSCGKQIHSSAITCPHCGEGTAEPAARKSKLVTLALSAAAAIIIVGGGFAASIFYPQYVESRTKSQQFEVVNLAQQATAKVEKYYRDHRAVPKTLEEAGGNSKPSTGTVQSVNVHPQKGTVTIVLGYGKVDGKSLVYTPTIDEKEIISWGCTSKDVPENLLPPGCKPEQQ